eukprot:7336304-Pyramimonas_sp.AAC.1
MLRLRVLVPRRQTHLARRCSGATACPYSVPIDNYASDLVPWHSSTLNVPFACLTTRTHVHTNAGTHRSSGSTQNAYHYGGTHASWNRGFAASVTVATIAVAAMTTVATAETRKEKAFPPVWFGFKRGFNEHYTLGQEIGKGSYGNVHKCNHRKERKEYAVKVLDKKKIRNAESIEDIDREVELLVLIQGQDNIIQLKVCAACSNLARMGFQAMQIGRFLKAFRLSFHESYEDEAMVYLVMELCEGGDLYDRIDDCRGASHSKAKNGRSRVFTEADVADLISQVLQALAHCHLKGVVICDIKPDNFLFDKRGSEGVLKAIDFGLSRQFTPGRPLRRAGGTAYFVAPE